jgi:hypothetical protein
MSTHGGAGAGRDGGAFSGSKSRTWGNPARTGRIGKIFVSKIEDAIRNDERGETAL